MRLPAAVGQARQPRASRRQFAATWRRSGRARSRGDVRPGVSPYAPAAAGRHAMRRQILDGITAARVLGGRAADPAGWCALDVIAAAVIQFGRADPAAAAAGRKDPDEAKTKEPRGSAGEGNGRRGACAAQRPVPTPKYEHPLFQIYRFVRNFRTLRCQESHAKCLSHIIFSPIFRSEFLDF